MPDHDPRIDAYIAKSAEFAQPILQHLRTLVHKACPEVEESIKWGMPFFSYEAAPMCMMAAFKQHCSFGFWLSKEVTGGSDGKEATRRPSTLCHAFVGSRRRSAHYPD